VKTFLLLVEDNLQIVQGNERMLRWQGYETAAALTLKQARAMLAARTPDLIILDIMLPDGSGLDFIRELRRTSEVPVLLLTGLTTPQDVVRGLTAGGDDYLAKPYDFGVLLARVEALLRRAGQIPKILAQGALRLDILASRAYLNGNDLLLTQKEFALLLLLAQNAGRALAPEYLYETVWKQPMQTDDQAVKSTLSRLRRKLGDSAEILFDAEAGGYLLVGSE
jgi:DNA-binding response OmpR family regulator